MNTIIKAKKDLYNGGRCFTKNRQYFVLFDRLIKNNASLMEAMVRNDQQEAHIIGSWWRDFEIVQADTLSQTETK